MSLNENPSSEDVENFKKRILDDRASLTILKKESEGMRPQLIQKVKSNLSLLFSQDEIEAIESAPANEAFALVLDKIEPYVQSALEEKDAEILKFEEEIERNHLNLEGISEMSTFLADNPDLDKEEFDEFVDYSLPRGKLKEIQELPSVRDGLDLVLKLFHESKGSALNEIENEIPLDVDGISGETGNLNTENEVNTKDDSIADVMGLNK